MITGIKLSKSYSIQINICKETLKNKRNKKKNGFGLNLGNG